MATYPSQVLVKGDVINEVDVVDQNDHNILKGEIIALQTYVGTNPQGSRNNLTDRLGTMMATNGAIAQSNGFPASTYEGQLHWRPDLFTAYIYSSSQVGWQSLGSSLSNVLFSYSPGNITGGSIINTGGASNTYCMGRFRKISSISRVDFHRYISGISAAAVNFTTVLAGTAVSFSTAGDGWGTTSHDVSGLTNGTYVDIIISINTSNSGHNPKVQGITAFGN